ncbi:MAG TPA: ATP-binding protein [Ktedonobacterales bacterium]|nr:ATP-binding protein [Ktedonobacterales bacterium]
MEKSRRAKVADTSVIATKYEHLEALVDGQCQVLELIAQELPLPRILDAIARWAETQSHEGLLASLLLVDTDGKHFAYGVGPSLPDAYIHALQGLAIGPAAGSCGTAAYIKKMVIVEDIATDPLWEQYRDLALPHGLRACWSTPLIAKTGDVLGTFALYYRIPRLPTADDLQIIRLVSRTAILAIEYLHVEEERARLLASERQALQKAQAERQRLYDLLMEAPAAIAVVRGPAYVFELANPLFMRGIGMGRDVLGRPIREALPELEGQGIYAVLDQVYGGGETFEGTELLFKLDRNRNGKLEDSYFNFACQPTMNDNNRVSGVLIHAVDVTELVRARERARENEEWFRTLADNISQFAWMADETGAIFWYNKRWYEYTGTTLEDVAGWGWQKVHHPDHVERVVNKISACFQSGEPWEDTFPLRAKDGEYRWFLSRAIPIRDGSGKVVRWFGTNTDVTEQRQLEQQKDDFIGIASHELKTPVTSLKAYAQLLALQFRRAGDTRSAEMLGRMDGQMNKLTRLIGELLDETNIKEGRLLLQMSTFDYGALVGEIIEDVQRTVARHTIICECVPAVTISGDRERIGQVLTNLLTNAVKYSPHADQVIVTTSLDGEEVVTKVQDFGIGIAQQKQTQVFDRFFRVQARELGTYPGLGLGLYISAEIVRRHHGHIWVESEEGKGSTFAFSLPLELPATSKG